MTDPASRLPARPSLEQLRKQAKELTKSGGMVLARAQLDLARRYGFASWAMLVHHVESINSSNRLAPFAQLAEDIVLVCRSDDAAALERIADLLGRTYPHPDRRTQLQQELQTLRGPEHRIADITSTDAQLIVARKYGFDSWAALAATTAKPADDPRSAPLGMSASPPFYRIDWTSNTLEPRPPLSDNDWDTICGVMREQRISGLNANGQMSNAALRRLAKLEHVTRLDLSGSNRLTDDGLRHLTGMPQLREIDLSGRDMQVTDAGLEVVRHLKALRRFQLCWPQRVSDAGMAHLASCDRLEIVDLMGTPTGDGAIKALTGKPTLCRFKSGTQVSDAGLPLLHRFPVFKRSQGGETELSLMSTGSEPNHLLIDGPFTNQGLASLAGLEGLCGLTIFGHASTITPDGLRALAGLPNLGFLGCGGRLCDDRAMLTISVLPRLRVLMAQGTVATDDGFTALSRSRTIEYLWGRECPNLQSRGFAALAGMPALRGLAVSCKHVNDDALSSLPRFPALRQLMPMDVQDDGFRHVGRCEGLEHLWCMYCRDTGDAATRHLAGLGRLRTYYAGVTRITDRSLEILGQVASLERIELYQCTGITNAGVARLARLPQLREVVLDGLSKVTRDGAAVFPARVRVTYST